MSAQAGKSRAMPTDTQGREMLAWLTRGKFGRHSFSVFFKCMKRGWFTRNGQIVLTPTGRAALASWLLRDMRGPYVAADEQSAMSHEEARAMVAVVADRKGARLTVQVLATLSRYEWIVLSNGRFTTALNVEATDAGCSSIGTWPGSSATRSSQLRIAGNVARSKSHSCATCV